MAFEIFTRKHTRLRDPSISFNKLGRIGLNQAATLTLQKDAVEFVLLLWNETTGVIALRPITKKDSRAYRISYAKRGNSSGFSAKTFLDWIEYDYSSTRSFPADWNEKEGRFEIKLLPETLKDESQRELAGVEEMKST